jgi:ERCC4-type nuclease
MNIVFDTRETKLLSYINNTNDTFLIKTENLDIGDIHLCQPDNTCIVIFERKSINDLAASIQDGRYKEQALRLSNFTLPNHHIIYIIEGDIDQYKPNSYSKHKITSKTLRSSIVSILYTKGFSVLFTKNTQDTANWIMQFAEKIYKNGISGYYNDNEPKQTNYTEQIKMKKQGNITPDNIDQIMLSQIPGISIIIANALLHTFSSLKLLTKSLETHTDILKDFTYTTTQGKQRKLPKNVISNLFLYLKI